MGGSYSSLASLALGSPSDGSNTDATNPNPNRNYSDLASLALGGGSSLPSAPQAPGATAAANATTSGVPNPFATTDAGLTSTLPPAPSTPSATNASQPWQPIDTTTPFAAAVKNVAEGGLGALGHAAQWFMGNVLGRPANAWDQFAQTWLQGPQGDQGTILPAIEAAAKGFAAPVNQQTTGTQVLENAYPSAPKWMDTVGGIGLDLANPIFLAEPTAALGSIAKATGLADAAAPVLQATSDALKSSPVVGPLIDELGTRFSRTYGVPQSVADLGQTAEAMKQADALHVEDAIAGAQQTAKQAGLTPNDLEYVARHLDNPTSYPLDATAGPREAAMADTAQTLKDYLANGVPISKGNGAAAADFLAGPTGASIPARVLGVKNEIAHGITDPESLLQDYYPHRYENPQQAAKLAAQRPNLPKTGPFNNARVLDTLAQAEAAGLKPILDPFQAVRQRLLESSRAIRNTELVNAVKAAAPDVLKEGGQFAHGFEDLGKIPQFRGYMATPTVKRYLEDLATPNAGRASGILGATYDKINGFLKRTGLYNALVHGHNLAYNGMYLGGVTPAEWQAAARDVAARGPMFTRALESGALTRLFEPGARLQEGLGGSVKSLLETPYRWNDQLLAKMEQPLRTALHNKAVQSGMSDLAAARLVNRFLGNYGNLSAFERNVMTRIFPFYSWMRTNLPLQLETLLSRPGMAARPLAAMNDVNAGVTGHGMAQNPQGENLDIATGLRVPGQNGPQEIYTNPYIPFLEPFQAAQEGPLGFLFNRAQALLREGTDQTLNKKYPLNSNQRIAAEPIAPAGVPNEGALRLAHLLNMVPRPVQAVLRDVGVNPGNQQPQAPTTPFEYLMGALGGRNYRYDPALAGFSTQADVRNAATNAARALRQEGQTVPPAIKRAERTGIVP